MTLLDFNVPNPALSLALHNIRLKLRNRFLGFRHFLLMLPLRFQILLLKTRIHLFLFRDFLLGFPPFEEERTRRTKGGNEQ